MLPITWTAWNICDRCRTRLLISQWSTRRMVYLSTATWGGTRMPSARRGRKKRGTVRFRRPSTFQSLSGFRRIKSYGGNYFPLPATRSWIVWVKHVPEEVSFSQAELCWTSFDKKTLVVDIPYCGCAGGARRFELIIHPTQKPTALYAWIYARYAKPGDRILDTHLGSGSSRIAAYDAGLDFVGCEIDKDYFDAQEARFAAHAAQESLFTGGLA